MQSFMPVEDRRMLSSGISDAFSYGEETRPIRDDGEGIASWCLFATSMIQMQMVLRSRRATANRDPSSDNANVGYAEGSSPPAVWMSRPDYSLASDDFLEGEARRVK